MPIAVLIVDDDQMVAEANKGYLESLSGFECAGMAASAVEAAEILANKDIHLVLLDIFMPGQSGLDLLALIRGSSQGVDVIVISAANDMANVTQALRLGAVDYLIKPFEFERFHAAMRSYQMTRRLFSDKDGLSQEELDTILLRQERPWIPTELPKGLTADTLKAIVFEIYVLSGQNPFTTANISNRLSLSRVTVGKYLRFLTDIGFVDSRLHYRTVGRPIYLYQLNPNRTDLIDKFLA